jgi:RNA polymerase sigma-70 factor (ECF subfamily)
VTQAEEGPVPADFAAQVIALLPRLRRFGAALAGSLDAADDLVQSACERAFRAPDRFEPDTRLDAWMFRIMRNIWIDQRRSQGRGLGRAGAPTSDPEVLEAIMGEDGREVTEARLTFDAVRATMATLPEEQREVLAAVCVEGLSYQEAAAMLEVPVGTVMSRLHRARRALALRLGLAGTGEGSGRP